MLIFGRTYLCSRFLWLHSIYRTLVTVTIRVNMVQSKSHLFIKWKKNGLTVQCRRVLDVCIYATATVHRPMQPAIKKKSCFQYFLVKLESSWSSVDLHQHGTSIHVFGKYPQSHSMDRMHRVQLCQLWRWQRMEFVPWPFARQWHVQVR